MNPATCPLGIRKMAVFRVVAPCNLVEDNQCFRGPFAASIIRAIILMMEAARTSARTSDCTSDVGSCSE
jgi:hypothetical protein